MNCWKWYNWCQGKGTVWNWIQDKRLGPNFCQNESMKKTGQICIWGTPMPHNVCSNIIGKLRKSFKQIMYMIWDISKYCWVPGIGKWCDKPIYRYYVNCFCYVLCFTSQWKQTVKKDTTRCKYQWIWDVPMNEQYIFIEVYQTKKIQIQNMFYFVI